MCVQCMMGAMSAGAGATGLRSWLALHRVHWLTPARMKVVTVTLIVAALGASSFAVSGSTPAPAKAAAPHPSPAPR